jgi:hypothetical protein
MRELRRCGITEQSLHVGSDIIGFDQHYVYPTGREGDIPLAGFSPRKQSPVIYSTGHRQQDFAGEIPSTPVSGACTSTSSMTWTRPCSRS